VRGTSLANTYLAIAQDALAEATFQFDRNVRMTSRGRRIISTDPAHRSFKASLVTIVFVGMYVDSLLYAEGRARFGRSDKDDDTYERKLRRMKAPPELVEAAKQFRKVRNKVVPRKACMIGAFGSLKRRPQWLLDLQRKSGPFCFHRS